MKKQTSLLLILMCCLFHLNAQINFSQFNYQEKVLAGLDMGTINHADFNGDGHVDLLCTGTDINGAFRTYLYFNDGLGEFTPSATFTGLPNVSKGFVDVADIDNDNDMDVFISGYINNNTWISRVYQNNGSAQFSLTTNLSNSLFHDELKVEFHDLDHDGDLDLFYSNNGTGIFWNSGNGRFVRDTLNILEYQKYSSFDFGDVDGDGDDDLVIMGQIASGSKLVYLYMNDGLGFFSKRVGTTVPFRGADAGDIAFLDYDNDNNLDIFYTGRDFFDNVRSRFYRNTGNGDFSIFGNGSVRAGDYDSCKVFILDLNGDSYDDIIYTSAGKSNHYIANYENDGQGDYDFKSMSAPVAEDMAIDFADLNGDQLIDYTHSGKGSSEKFVTPYFYDGLKTFSRPITKPYRGLGHASIALGDFNGDNHPDLITSGSDGIYTTTRLYANDGNGDFNYHGSGPFPNSSFFTHFFDIDNDNDMDLLMATSDSLSLFKNDGSGNFTKTTRDYVGLVAMDFDFGDLDGDGDMDFVMSGLGAQRYVRAFINNGSGDFVQYGGFTGHTSGDIKLFDADQDNDLDVLITGGIDSWPNDYSTIDVYLNDGSARFTKLSTQPFIALRKGQIAIGDIDGDNDDDVIMNGIDGNDVLQTYLYKNRGNAVFQRVQNTPFTRLRSGNLEFVDFDKDGDLDLFLSGAATTTIYTNAIGVVELYENDGNGNFNLIQDQISDINAASNSMAIEDINGDGFQDMVISGYDRNLNRSLSFYFNRSCESLDSLTINECFEYYSATGVRYDRSGTYYDTLQNRLGCDSIIKLKLTITTIDTSVIDSTSFLIAKTNNGTYQWLNCINNYQPIGYRDSDKYFYPDNDGHYAVEITLNNCKDTSTCYNVIGIGIEEKKSIQFDLYPNPSTDQITVIFGQEDLPVRYKIVNVEGREILSGQWLNAVNSINHQLTNGIYNLILDTKDRRSSRRFIVLE